MESVREMIEKRAYELFLKRGAVEGYHIQDWIQAEQEIMAQLEKKSASTATTKKAAAKPKSAPAKAAPAKAKAEPAKKKAPVKKKGAAKKTPAKKK